MGENQSLATWGGKSSFSYCRSVDGISIRYGKGFSQNITIDQYVALRVHFEDKTVNIGTSRTNPPPGSVGEWLQNNVSRTALASYVGAILVAEESAEKVGRGLIRFEAIPYAAIWNQFVPSAMQFMKGNQAERFRADCIEDYSFNSWKTIGDVPLKWRELLIHLWHLVRECSLWRPYRFEFLAPTSQAVDD